MKIFIQISLLVVAACAPDPKAQVNESRKAAASPVVSRSAPAKSTPNAPTVTAEPAPPPRVPGEPPKLAVEGEGLRWFLPPNASARPLSFGMLQGQVLASLEHVRGPARKGKNEDCGAGPVEYATWPDGLSLVFQDGRFAGWGLDGRAAGAIATANGVGPGMTRAKLAKSFGSVSFRQSSLGTEFEAGEMFGVLDGSGAKAKITDMWAGISCIAR